MKRFFLFAYNTCYPNGGMQDFVLDFDSLEKARAAANQRTEDNYQIFDCEKRIVVETNDESLSDIHDWVNYYENGRGWLKKLFPKSAFK